MKKLVTTFVLVMLQSIFISIYAGVMVGTVTDKQTKEPLTGATIKVENSSMGAVADLDGNYTLELQNGNYTLIANYVGYQQIVRQVTVDGAKISENGGSWSEGVIGAQTQTYRSYTNVSIRKG